MAIEFSVSVAVPAPGTADATITLANHTRTLRFYLQDFVNPPSKADFRSAVEVLMRAAYHAKTGTPAQRIAAMEAGITKLAYFDYANGVEVNP